MASSTDSDSNTSLAPIEFNFTVSLESSGCMSVAVERCPLCSNARRPFYCKTCIAAGNFFHSKSGDDFDMLYTDRMLEWDAKKRERDKLFERIKEAVHRKQQLDKKRIDFLRKAILKGKEDFAKDKIKLRTLKETRATRSRKSVKHREKVGNIHQYISQVGEDKQRLSQSLNMVLEQLVMTRRSQVDNLVQNIFPVVDIQPRSEPDNLALSTVSALKDATHTAYIKGRWVYADHTGDLQYKVVESILPGSGDYSAYSLWIATNKENVNSAQDTKTNQRNPAYSISAGLCYTAQLTIILGHILDVTLPRKLCFSEFCGEELSEKQFNNSVARLNQNVLYLCFSQGVDVDILFPRYTLHNVLALLNSPHLGRVSSFEVNPDLIESIGEEIVSSDDSDDGHALSDDEADLGADWEAVPQELTPFDLHVPTRAYNSGTSDVQTTAHSSEMMTQTTQIATGGLMSSAAASVASFWRAATGQLERR